METKKNRLPQDIFKLDYNKIENLEGWGKQSAINLKYSINKSKEISLEKLIYSLGIRHIGQENAKLISQNIQTLDNLCKISNKYNFNTFLNIDGIGETQINSLKKFFSNNINLEIIKELKKFILIKKSNLKITGKLKNKTFIFTGKLDAMSRAEAKSLIEKNSGKILSNVNKKLDYLIIGEKPTTKKVLKAKELNIKVISQAEFLKLLD